jgi:hypothetical protein
VNERFTACAKTNFAHPTTAYCMQGLTGIRIRARDYQGVILVLPLVFRMQAGVWLLV